jgi:hypothetical protein
MGFDFGHWGIFPPELYILLLECLKHKDKTARRSHAILHISLLSRSHHELVNRWAAGVEKNRILKIRELEASGETPLTSTNSQRTSLSILCKRLARICVVCNCRIETTERFSGLDLCQICDAFFFPKVSTIRFADLFTLTPLGVQKLEDTQQLLSSLLKRESEKANRWPDEETADKVHFSRLIDLLKLLSDGFLESKRQFNCWGG